MIGGQQVVPGLSYVVTVHALCHRVVAIAEDAEAAVAAARGAQRGNWAKMNMKSTGRPPASHAHKFFYNLTRTTYCYSINVCECSANDSEPPGILHFATFCH